jgi:hypothetical protein
MGLSRWASLPLLLLAAPGVACAGVASYLTVGGLRYYGAGQPYTVRNGGRCVP